MGKLSRNHKKKQPGKITPTPEMLPPAITELFSDYRLSLAALGRSPKTISSYFNILERFFAFLVSKGLLKAVTELGRPELKAYLIYLHNCRRWPNRPNNCENTGTLSAFTIQDHVRTLKAFWGWLTREDYIQRNPLEKFPLPSVPKVILKTITPEIFTRLLTLINRSTPLGVQRYCIFLALYDGGLRISEIAECRIDNIDMNTGLMRVVGKGNKERDVPLSRMTVREIRRYIRDTRSQICPEESPYLFPKPDGAPITINSIQQFMRRLAKSTGIEGLRLYPHLLRHSFGTQFIVAGGNPFVLKEIMGHASLATTLKYTHLQSEDLRREHARFSPVGNLKIGRQKGY